MAMMKVTDGKYLRIANEASNVNRLYLEKLGISTKRDDESTIGQFGSGAKFAPICALRRGLEWINVGQDDRGHYKMEYVVEKEDDIDCIFFRYNDGEVMKPSSFTKDAGSLSWDDPFQIIREAFSNALDANTSEGAKYFTEMTDEVKFEDGIFSVYITADQNLLDIVNRFDDYFCINRDDKVADISTGKVFWPAGALVNVFYKGVNVYRGDERSSPSVFDYEFNDMTLNEERRVRHEFDMQAKIGYAWMQMANLDPDIHPEVLEFGKQVVNSCTYSKFEFNLSNDYAFENFVAPGNNGVLRAWLDIMGDDVIISTVKLKMFSSQAMIHGYKSPIFLNPWIYNFLAGCGVKTLASIIGDQADYDFVEIGGYQLDNFNKAMKIACSYDDRLTAFLGKIKFFKPGKNQKIWGVATPEHNIYLSTDCVDDIAKTVGTLIHELDHVVSGYRDEHYSEFRGLADDRIAELIMKAYGDANG